MEARTNGALRMVPWESWQLWNEVREAVFSSLPERVSAALNKIAAWRARITLPVALEVTWDLISIQRTDPYFWGQSCPENSITNEMLCLMYAMAIMRLINGIVDHSKKQSSLSVADRAEAAGLPRMLVDIRHEVAHQELPSLSYLRLASKEALEWLKVHYWEAQKEVLDLSHKHLQEKVQAYASRSDASESKVLFQGRKRSLTLHAKKLVMLSGPAVDPFDDKTNGVSTDELMKGEAKEDKFNDSECSDNSVDAQFQTSERALSRAKKRLRSFCRSQHTIQSMCRDADFEESVPTASGLASTLTNDHGKVETGLLKIQSSSKAIWAVAENWKPCAIGMLPSKINPVGVLPFLGNPFPDVAKEASACQVATAQEKLSRETDANVRVKKALEVVTALETETQHSNPCVEMRGFSESDVVLKRLKTHTEDRQVLESQEDLFPVDSQLHSDVLSKDSKLLQNGLPSSQKREASLSSGGFLLLEGIYQRCRVGQLAAIQSSIQLLK